MHYVVLWRNGGQKPKINRCSVCSAIVPTSIGRMQLCEAAGHSQLGMKSFALSLTLSWFVWSKSRFTRPWTTDWKKLQTLNCIFSSENVFLYIHGMKIHGGRNYEWKWWTYCGKKLLVRKCLDSHSGYLENSMKVIWYLSYTYVSTSTGGK
jgi:hypothetical protein